jgi:hypothetical protein
MKKFLTQFNRPKPYFEKNNGISITNPDPGMSIKEMVEKYVIGAELPKGLPVHYSEDEQLMLPTGIDLSDITEAQTLAAYLNDVEEGVKAAKSAAKAVIAANLLRQKEDSVTILANKTDAGQRPEPKKE